MQVHRGRSCDARGGHYFDGENDPWRATKYAVYFTQFSATLILLKTNRDYHHNQELAIRNDLISWLQSEYTIQLYNVFEL